ncbi:ABC transporter permease [Reyranella soli]|uniref:ABC transporter permease n=1 Tax=Reyranella soli TaxID=1230389 RepID=A0A512NIS4_9HYPH|nr:ABC transporter permease [Reyranella soli]
MVARYVFHQPVIWSDELAAILFLWLAMLGSTIALRRGAHMRLTLFVNLAPPAMRAWLEAAGSLVIALFVALIIVPAAEYAAAERFITTPALEVANSWRTSAIVVCAVLMMAVVLLRMAEQARPSRLFAVAAVGAVAAGGLWLLQPLLLAMGNFNLLVFFCGLTAVCIAIGVPIAFGFGIATLSYLALMTSVPLTVVVSRMEEGMSHLILLSVPLFVFLGLLIEVTGMARAMVSFLASLLGHVRGGLSYVLLAAMYLVSGISGAKAADMAAVAPVLFPEMKKRGAHPGELVALLSASGAMSETIPPSLVLITIGSVTGVSIAALFTGGLLPALLLALLLAVVAYFRSRREDLSAVGRPGARAIGKAFVVAIPALILPVVIRTAVVEGVATATEVSTIGIVYTAIIGILVYRTFPLRTMYPLLVETAALTGAILLIIGAATAMGWALTQSGFSRQLAEVMTRMPGGALGFLAVSVVAFAILGSVLEGIPAIVLFGPLLFPIARQVGVNEVHYAMVAILSMSLGLFAPPLGVGFYVACAIGKVDPDLALGRVWVYLAALLVGVVLIVLFPWLSIGFL